METPDRELVSPVLRTACEHPHRMAVIAPDGRATYGQLVAHAVTLAHDFRHRGVGPGDRVGVVLKPGRDAIAVSIATLLLGGAYVPIDPAQPDARIRALLTGCAVPLFVTASGDRFGALTEVGPADWSSDPVGTSGVAVDPAGFGAAAPAVVVDGSRVAYVVHTSGSTGTPKAVEVEHRGVVNLVSDFDRRVPMPEPYVGTWWTSPGFDVSVWEVWAPLLHGGTVVVVPDESRLEGARFAEFLDSAQAHSAYVPPPFLHDLRDHFRKSADTCRSLRRLLVGVEPIPLGLLQEIMDLRTGLAIVNGYGPAETTVCATAYTVPRRGGTPNDRTPIGVAVTGNRLYVLDGEGRTAVDGAGELVVAGSGVARGYLGRPAASDERFIREPGRPDQRAYRTGDLVRTLPDGNLVFEGRADRQLKIRGYRVEPGEVEAALRRVAALREVVVDARVIPETGLPVIAAYLVMEPGHRLDRAEALAAVRKLLPLHAVPGVLLELERMPQTVHGKIDHAALAALPVPARPFADDRAEAAAGSVVHGFLDDVITAWNTVLGTGLARHDSAFVDVGGTSLAAARVAVMLRHSTGREVSATHVLGAERATSLADIIERAPRTTSHESTAQPRMTGRLSAAQAGLWLHEQVDPRPGRYVESVCFDIRGPLDADRLIAAVTDAVEIRPAFRAVVRERRGGPEWELGHHRVPVEVRDVAGATSADELFGMPAQELRQPFDLTGGPLTRCMLMRVSPDHHVLLLAWHHLVIDGWSARAVLTDIALAYAEPGHPLATAQLTICDLAADQAKRVRRPEFGTRVEAVVTSLRSVPVAVDWPGPEAARPASGTHPETGTDGTGGRSLPLSVPTALVHAAARQAAAHHVTLQTFTVAAFERAVERVVGVQRFLLGWATAGRGRPLSETVAGYLVNTVLLKGGGLAGMSTSEALVAVADEIGRGRADDDIPFPMVAEALLRDCRPRPVSFPDIMFSFDDEITLTLPGLECHRRRLPAPQVKLPLTLSLEYGPGRLSGYLQHRDSALSTARATLLLTTFVAEMGGMAAAGVTTRARTDEVGVLRS